MKSNVQRAILASLLIQGLGSFAPFLTIIALARLSGPVTQGTFSTFKTWADLVSSLVVFGFPQAFVYLLNKRAVLKADLLTFSLLYVILSTICVFPVAALSARFGYNYVPQGQALLPHAAYLTVGIGALVLHRLVRAIYLTMDDGFLFSLITSAPAFFVLGTMVAAASMSTAFPYDSAFFAAGLATCLATGIWIKRIVQDAGGFRFKIPSVPKRAMAQQSLHSFLQSMSFTLQPVLTIYFLVAYDAGVKGVAYFTSASIIIAAVNVFFGIVSPILFNRWSANLDRGLFGLILATSDKIALGFLVLGVATIPLYPIVVPLVFGLKYEAAVTAFQIVGLSIAPVAFTRTISSAVHAGGRAYVNTIACALRLASSVIVQLALSHTGGVSPLLAAAAGWAIAEWLSAAYAWQAGRRMLKCMK